MVLSDDNYFINSMNIIENDLGRKAIHKRCFLDTGYGIVYVLNISEIKQSGVKDPLNLFINNREFALKKNSSIEDYYRAFLAKPKTLTGRFSDVLTRSEMRVIRSVYGGRTQADIASSMNINSKTVNSHKQNAFRKLGIKNHLMFYLIMNSWSKKIPQLLTAEKINFSSRLSIAGAKYQR